MDPKTLNNQQRDLQDYAYRYNSAVYRYEREMVEKRHRFAITEMNSYSHKMILEVGCGMSPMFMYYGKFEKMIVIEPSSVFFRHAQKQLKKIAPSRAKKIQLLNNYVEELESVLCKYDFDFVLCIGLLHEVPNDKKLMRILRRIMSKGAVLHINVPNAKSFHRLLAVEMDLIESEYVDSKMQKRMQQQRIYDMESLRELVCESGFKVLKEGTCFIKPFTHAQMDRLSKIGFATRKMQNGLDKMVKYMPDMGAEIFITAQAV